MRRRQQQRKPIIRPLADMPRPWFARIPLAIWHTGLLARCSSAEASLLLLIAARSFSKDALDFSSTNGRAARRLGPWISLSDSDAQQLLGLSGPTIRAAAIRLSRRQLEGRVIFQGERGDEGLPSRYRLLNSLADPSLVETAAALARQISAADAKSSPARRRPGPDRPAPGRYENLPRAVRVDLDAPAGKRRR